MVKSRHYLKPLTDRFWSKVDKTDTCWLWTAGTDKDNYGVFRADHSNWRAHRLTYEDTFGPIPDGLVIDHLCRVHNCVNPYHTEPVTNGVNIMRGDTFPARNAAKTHCCKGHEYTPENTGLQSGPTKKRYCRQCERDRNKKRRGYLTNYMRTYRKRGSPHTRENQLAVE